MTPCIEWQGARDARGYGMTTVHYRTHHAHRVEWEKVHGPIPEGLYVLHKCDNPPCINVEHLFLGTHADNMRDRNTKGRQARGERHSQAKLNDDDVRSIKASSLPTPLLATQYNVTRQTIWSIRAGRTWRHVQSTQTKGPDNAGEVI